MREIENIVPQGGLNLDDDKRFMPNTDSDYRLNIQYETSKAGTIVPIKGSAKIGSLGGHIKGWCQDVENDRLFYFVQKGDAPLYYLEGTTLSSLFPNETSIFEDTVDNVDCRVIDGKLIWTDGVNDKRKINIQRAINTKTYEDLGAKTFVGEPLVIENRDYVHVQGMGIYLKSGGFTPQNLTLTSLVTEISSGALEFVTDDVYWDIDGDVSQIVFIKKPPTQTVTVDEVIATGTDRNAIVERLMSFSYRYVYKDKEKSVFAKPSRIVFNPYGTGTEESDTFNAVNITLYRGNNDVEKVEVAMQNVLTGNWFKIGEVKNSDFLAQDTYTFQFQGGMVAEPIDNAEVEKAFDAVPKKVGTLCTIENRVIDGDITEGFTIDTIPTISAQAIESESLNLFGAVAYTGRNNWSGSPDPIIFPNRKYTSILTESEIVPFGVRIAILLVWTEGLISKTKLVSVVSDGTETMADFAERFATEINLVHLDTSIPSVERTSKFNLFAGVQLNGDDDDDSGDVVLTISNGLPRMVSAEDLDLADYAGFDGNIYDGDVLYDSLITSSEIFVLSNYTIVSDVIYTLDVSSGTTIFKGNSTYTLGLTYYDDYLRKTPVVSKTTVAIPDGQYEKGAYPLEVTISGEAPDWAKYYSIARSKGSVTNGELVHVLGGGNATESDLSGDTSTPGLVKELFVDGIRYDQTTAGLIFWEWNYILYGGSGYYSFFSIWPTQAGGSYISRSVYIGQRSSYIDEDGERVRKLELLMGGYVILRMDSIGTDQLRTADRTISLGFSTKEENDDGDFIYKINISQYINSVKKSLDLEQDIYTPSRGDKVRVLKDSNSATGLFTIENIEEEKVSSVEGEDEQYFVAYYITTYPSSVELNFDNGGIIEMFVEEIDDSLLYEESKLYPIEYEGGLYQHKGGLDQPDGGTIIYTLEGDAYLRERDYVSSNGTVIQTSAVESLRASDSYNSKVWARGRVNTFDSTAKEKTLTTALRHGGRLLNETFINDICKFNSENILVLPPDYGRIIRLIERPNYIKAICEKRSVTIEIGREIVTRPDGQDELVAISRVFGTQRPSMNRWGTMDFRSVVDTGTELFYFDRSSRQMLSDGQNGQFPISGKVSQGEYAQDYKMHSFFRDMTTAVCGWDEDNKMLYVTGLVNSVTTTVGFHRPSNRWLSYYSFKPEIYLMLNNRMFTSITYLWEHNLDTFNGSAVPRCYYYNLQFDSEVKLISNQHPLNMKIFDAITLRAQGLTSIPNDFIILETEANDTYDRGMYSIITEGMLRLEEGEYRAEILRNMKSTTSTPSNSDLHNGDPMRGYYIEMLLDFSTSNYKLLGMSVMQTISK